MITITPDEIQVLSRYVHSLCGVYLDATKGYLFENRLASLLEATHSQNFSELYFKAKSDPTRRLPRQIIDALTTGETSFYRDQTPFDLLQHKLLPDLIDRKNRTARPGSRLCLRIWSAACSSGQEIYSIAMVLKDLLDVSRYDLFLLGTDISDQAVAQASRGLYRNVEMERGLSTAQVERYFERVGDEWKIRDEIRSLAVFQRLNLLEDFRHLGCFDIIFCRNVAIYFTEHDRAGLFGQIADALDPEGYLIIGSTETLTGVSNRLESRRYLRSIFYQLKPNA